MRSAHDGIMKDFLIVNIDNTNQLVIVILYEHTISKRLQVYYMNRCILSVFMAEQRWENCDSEVQRSRNNGEWESKDIHITVKHL